MMRLGRRAAAWSLALGLYLSLASAASASEPPGGAFALVDADGKPVKSTDFLGKWLFIYFGYTHCADQCPTGLSIMAEALDEIGPAADHVQPLFITIDPEHDHGAGLASFTAAFDKRLIGLSGAPDQIAAVARSFGASYDKVVLDENDYVIDHSSTYYLVDPTGRFAESFKISEPYLVAAKLFELLDRSGVSLGNVNNLGAYR